MIQKAISFTFLLLLIFNKVVLSQNFDAEVIKYSVFCEVEKNKVSQTDSVIIQVNNRFGDKYTEIEIPYSKGKKVSNIDAWIEKIDGTKVRGLKTSEIIDKSAISDYSLYEDDFEKCFQLKHNIYPYRVVFTYKIIEKNFLSITEFTPIRKFDIPTRLAKLKVKIPKGFQFKKFVNAVSECKLDSTQTDLLFEWKTSYDKPFKNEIFSQPKFYTPYIVLIPLNFNYGVEGSTKDWESYGNWQYRLMQGCDDLPDKEKKTVLELIKGVSDKKEIVKIVYHYLQDHTRYINVSIGIGGLKPYPASYVAENKYGDCKALTNYLKAMLSYAGIESFYTIVYASEQPNYVLKSFTGSFNHIVLAVPLNNDTIWLENTSNITPFGYMGTFTQNREALLISENNSRLVKIPQLKKEETLVSFKLDFNLNISGNTDLALKATFKGKDYEYFNELNSELNGNEKDRIIKEYMPFDNYEVNKWELKKIHRDTARIELNASLNLSQFLKPLGNEYYFSLHSIRIPNFSIAANRTLPVILPYPVYNSDTLVYNLPIGYELKTKLDTISIKSRFGNYKQALNLSNGKIYAVKSFELFSGTYSLEQYSEFYNFIKSIKDVDRKKIIIKPLTSNILN